MIGQIEDKMIEDQMIEDKRDRRLDYWMIEDQRIGR